MTPCSHDESHPLATAPDAAAPAPATAPVARWQVHLLGRVEACAGDARLTRFNSLPTAALLARLALQPHRQHPREELIELLWPGATVEVGRNRLRQALSTLRRLLEPPGSGGAPVLRADRHGISVVAGALACDVLQFEACCREQRRDAGRRLYVGELMPGYYGDWVQEERLRLAALFERLDGLPDPPRAAEAPALPAPASPAQPVVPLQLLPAPLTRFFGRQVEHRDLLAAVAASRLVTLSGVGGCGKTRLALEVARDVAGFEGVVFVRLADCDHVAQALTQWRAALQLPAGAHDVQTQIEHALAGRHVLQVLDNFEQLVAQGGAELVETLLSRLPRLHVLVTSRRLLGVPGECELPLSALPLPPAGATLQSVVGNPGVALFADRARSVRPDFTVTERNHEAVAALCRALEGVPLALELAAARSRAHTLRELNDALVRPLALLARTGNHGRSTPRHDSLRAAIEWSWRLLLPRQQALLAAASVFRGGWTADAAQAVCEEPEARELLESLLADSLLSASSGRGGAMRFDMLALIRGFVTDKLDSARLHRLRGQHRAHLLAWSLALQASGASGLDEDELPNILQALRTALEDGQPNLALTLGVALRSQWDSRGMDPEMLALLCRAADRADIDSSALPLGCAMLAGLLLDAGQVPAALAQAERALALAEDRPALRAAALCAWVRVRAEGERLCAGLVERLDEAERLAAGQPELLAQAARLRGWLALRIDHDAVTAEGWFDRAAQHWLAAGQLREARLLRYDRAICLLDARRHDEALVQAELCERECDEIGERARGAAAINLQGVLLAAQRRWADAIRAYGRCVHASRSHHQTYWLMFALWNHGRNLARLRRPGAAARLMAFSREHWTRHVGPLDRDEEQFVRKVRRLVSAQLGAEAADREWQAGAQMTLAEAVALSQRCCSELDAAAIRP